MGTNGRSDDVIIDSDFNGTLSKSLVGANKTGNIQLLMFSIFGKCSAV